MASKRSNNHSKAGNKDQAEVTLPLPQDPKDPLGLPASVERTVEVVEQAGGRTQTRGKSKRSSAKDNAWAGSEPYRVTPGHPIRLSAIDPGKSGPYKSKGDVKQELQALQKTLEELQVRLYAESKQSLLVVLQAMDTGGKDGTNSQRVRRREPAGLRSMVVQGAHPEELAHDFLWRCHVKCPPRGMIAIFNRSYYEDVLVTRVAELVPKDYATNATRQSTTSSARSR